MLLFLSKTPQMQPVLANRAYRVCNVLIESTTPPMTQAKTTFCGAPGRALHSSVLACHSSPLRIYNKVPWPLNFAVFPQASFPPLLSFVLAAAPLSSLFVAPILFTKTETFRRQAPISTLFTITAFPLQHLLFGKPKTQQ